MAGKFYMIECIFNRTSYKFDPVVTGDVELLDENDTCLHKPQVLTGHCNQGDIATGGGGRVHPTGGDVGDDPAKPLRYALYASHPVFEGNGRSWWLVQYYPPIELVPPEDGIESFYFNLRAYIICMTP